MPYADPEQKRLYQEVYNRKYYQNYKDTKHLVAKATKSKTLLREKKRDYLLNQLGHKCLVCGIADPTVLLVKITNKTHIQKWGEKSYKSLYDYSWDKLDVIWPTLKIICSACLERQNPRQKKALKNLMEGDLPIGYTLDDDLHDPHTNL